jgi:phage protein D/phage baseplate assembly protein gpV
MPGDTTTPKVNQVEIKIDGADLPNSMMDKLFEVEVETSLYLPSMFTLRFHDETLELIDSNAYSAGKSVEIKFADTRNTTTTTLISVFKGEITAIEPEFTDEFMGELVIRGYDKGHRLNRGTKNRVFKQSTDSDIVKKIAGENGLSVQADATTEVYEHVFQYAVNDWAFVHERARRNNFEVVVEDGKLYFRKTTTSSPSVTLTWGVTMRRFQPRMSLSKQADTVKVRGWDPKKKQSILGQASSSSSSPSTGIGDGGGPLSKKAFSAAEVLEIRHPVRSQKEADTMAQAILDEINAGFLEAEGVAFGNPNLKAGIKVKIEKVGTKFSGSNIVTTARHIYSAEGYDTHFTVQGARAQTISDLVDQSMTQQRAGQLWGGIVPALVTNNVDPDNMGRVKVKFPWLDDTLESNWARVSSVAAGNQRVFFWLPEVNDEVLVAFEHGDFDYPYVVGALWNGQDKPPEQSDSAVSGGKVVIRTLKTTAGHIIRLTDTSGSEKIEVIGAKTNSKIILDEANKKISMESSGDIEVTATGNLTLKGKDVKVEASGNLEAKATGTGKLESTSALTIKGQVVNIN